MPNRVNKLNQPATYGLILPDTRGEINRPQPSLDTEERCRAIRKSYGLLKPFCEDIFVASATIPRDACLQDFELLDDIDPFTNIGPIGHVLTAMTLYPQAAWFVLGVDSTYVNEKSVRRLWFHRKISSPATAFLRVQEAYPYLAIYEPEASDAMMEFRKEGKTCLRKFLHQISAHLVRLSDKIAVEKLQQGETKLRRAKSYF